MSIYVGGRQVSGFSIGDPLVIGTAGDIAAALGVGDYEGAYTHLERTFGASAPSDDYAAFERTFGTGDYGLSGVGLEGIFDIVEDIGSAVVAPVKAIGKAAGRAPAAVAKVASGAANEAKKAVVSGAKLIAKTGGDAGKFVADQAKKFAKDPIGQLTKVASSGGLSLIGVDPGKILKAAGIPTPNDMLKSIGVPTPDQIVRESYTAITDPKQLLAKVPGIGELAKYIPSMPDPQKLAGELVDAALSGDLDKLKTSALAIGHQVADVVSMVPGAGNVIGAPLSAAITLIETGSALKAALQLLLSQVPGIPPQIRDILRSVLNGIADIVERGKAVTDVLLTEFKQGALDQAKKVGIPSELVDVVENVLDGAVQVIFRSKPLDRAALDMAKKGVETATKKLGAGNPEVKKAQEALSDLKKVYDKVDSVHALTQGIAKLAKQDAKKKDPVKEKRIKDMRAAIEAESLVAQGHAKKVDANLGKRPPQLRSGASPAKRPSAPAKPPPTLKPSAKAPAKAPPTLKPKAPVAPRGAAPTAKRYGPYPAMAAPGAVGASSTRRWFFWYVFKDGRYVTAVGPQQLTDYDAFLTEERTKVNNFGAELYRLIWQPGMPTWLYDARSTHELHAGLPPRTSTAAA